MDFAVADFERALLLSFVPEGAKKKAKVDVDGGEGVVIKTKSIGRATTKKQGKEITSMSSVGSGERSG